MSTQDDLASKSLNFLQNDFIVIGKTRVRSWEAWVIIGFLVGVTVTGAWFASRSGGFTEGIAAASGTIRGRVYHDINGNNLLDINEPYLQDTSAGSGVGCPMNHGGVPNIILPDIVIRYVSGPTSFPDQLLDKCDPPSFKAPRYRVSNLAPGLYTLQVIPPQGWTCGAHCTQTKELLPGGEIGMPFGIRKAVAGVFDLITLSGSAAGWALDPVAPLDSLKVTFYVDGPMGEGTFMGAVTANKSRPDVNRRTGYSGDHGFSFKIPQQFLSGYRTFHAYALDSSATSITQLKGSPISIGAKPSGNAQIKGEFGNSPILITTTDRLAGAIGSLTWKGKEFINDYDHGRELQSASSFNNLSGCFNPTEAGSRWDSTGPTSTSVLQLLRASGNVLETQTQMAFWLAPGQTGRCGDGFAVNTSALSNHLLYKKVSIGFQGIANVIEHAVTFTVPDSYEKATFEALTAYMPADFSQFLTYDPKTKTLAPLSDGPGEQDIPIIFTTPDEAYAFGVYSPDLPPIGKKNGYGRWRFANLPGPGNATVKWNCVFREKPAPAGQYSYKCYSIIGTLADVTSSMNKLHAIYFRG